MYWWQKAANLVRDKEAKQFGFITTNSITQVFNRTVIENNISPKGNLGLAFAIPDHPWVDSSDGAAVRIAMTSAAEMGSSNGVLQNLIKEVSKDDIEMEVVFEKKLGEIRSGLTIGANLSIAKKLQSNDNLASQGVNPLGLGFRLTRSDLVEFGYNPDVLPAQIRPYLIGRDIVQRPVEKFVIDFTGLSEEAARLSHPVIFHHVLTHVKPERDHNRRKTRRENWWLFGENAPMFREASEHLSKYIITCRTSKHRLFTFADINSLPDAKIVAIALDDEFYLSLLSSRLHIIWAMATGGWLGAGNDSNYNHSDCFGKFPMPTANEDQYLGLQKLAQELEILRNNVRAKTPELTLTNIYNVVEKVRHKKQLSQAEIEIHDKGLVSSLVYIHDKLDQKVFELYGWEDLAQRLVCQPGATTPLPDKSDEQAEAEEELLMRLVELNHRRAEEEAQGHIRWLRPDYQSPDVQQADIDLAEVSDQVTTKKKAATKKATWPKEMRDQINVLLEMLSIPATAETMAENFKRKPLKHVSAVLEALETLGKAQSNDGVWSLT